jgi:hypothetical protein
MVSISPFNIFDAETVPHTTLEDVQGMISEVEAQHGLMIAGDVISDVFWRTGGHPSLLSLLGCHLLALAQLHAGHVICTTWAAFVDSYEFAAALSESATVKGMLQAVNIARDSIPVVHDARLLLRYILCFPEDEPLVSTVNSESEAQEYLVSEGILRTHASSESSSTAELCVCLPMLVSLLRGESSSTAEWCVCSPMLVPLLRGESSSTAEWCVCSPMLVPLLRGESSSTAEWCVCSPMLVPLLRGEVASYARLSLMPYNPFPRQYGGIHVDLQRTVLEVIPFLNLEELFHPCVKPKEGGPSEYAYHSALCDLLRHRASNCGWHVLGETRKDGCGGSLRRLDIVIASDSTRCGILLVVNAKDLETHLHEQALAYKTQEKLNNVLVLNFASSEGGIADVVPAPLPAGVELLQLLVDKDTRSFTPFTPTGDGVAQQQERVYEEGGIDGVSHLHSGAGSSTEAPPCGLHAVSGGSPCVIKLAVVWNGRPTREVLRPPNPTLTDALDKAIAQLVERGGTQWSTVRTTHRGEGT